MADKRFPPTPKRLKDARAKGQVAYSTDVAGAAVFVVVLVALWGLGPMLFSLLLDLWAHATDALLFTQPQARWGEVLVHAARVLGATVLAVALLSGLAGAAGSFFQVGGLMAWQRIAPDVSRLNPAQGLQRIFSTRNLFDLLKTIVKVALLAGLIFVAVRSELDTALKLGFAQPQAIVSVGARVVLAVFGWAAVIFVVMSAADYANQAWHHQKDLRMSLDEIRREYRDQMGDPQRRARRRVVHQEAVYWSLADRVRASALVVHAHGVAVALQHLGPGQLPRVLARGEGDFADRIVELAQAAQLPLLADAALAARLYEDAVQDQPIPRALYEPVARQAGWLPAGDTPEPGA